MQTRFLQLLLAFSIAVLVGIAWAFHGFAFRPAGVIRQAILNDTPIGTTASEVLTIVSRKGWLVPSYAGNTGFLKQESNEAIQVVGVKSIKGNVADWGPMNVSAYWGFNREGRLIDVWIWRSFDLL